MAFTALQLVPVPDPAPYPSPIQPKAQSHVNVGGPLGPSRGTAQEPRGAQEGSRTARGTIRGYAAMHRRYRRPPSPSLSTLASPHFLLAFLALRPFLLLAPPLPTVARSFALVREDRTGYQGMPTEFNSRTATARFSTQAATIIAAASTTRSTRIGGGGEATPPPPSGGHLQR